MACRRAFILLLACVLGALAITTHGLSLGARQRRYKQGEDVTLYASIVGPFMDPSETYLYYTLPYCEPAGGPVYVPPSLGEALSGQRLAATPYRLPFRTDVGSAVLCDRQLGTGELARLRAAMDRDFYFQLFYDDLTAMGFVGMVVDAQGRLAQGGAGSGSLPVAGRRHFLITHLHFDIAFNGDQVIDVNVSTHPSRMLEISHGAVAAAAAAGGGGAGGGGGGGGSGANGTRGGSGAAAAVAGAGAAAGGVTARFSYSARWRETSVPYGRRLDRWKAYASKPELLVEHWRALQRSWLTALALSAALAALLLARSALRVARSWVASALARRRRRRAKPAAAAAAAVLRPPACGTAGAACGLTQPLLLTVPPPPTLRPRGAADGGCWAPGDRCPEDPVAPFTASAAAASSREQRPCPLPLPLLLAAAVGCGSQLGAVAVGVMALALVGAFRPFDRGRMLAALVVLYMATSGVSTYVAGRLHTGSTGSTGLSGRRLTCVVLVCAVLYGGPVLVVFGAVNTIATAQSSSAALPLTTVAFIALLWGVLAAPLLLLGAVAAGRRGAARLDGLFRTTKDADAAECRAARRLGPGWFSRWRTAACTAVQVVLAGRLGLYVSSIELYYVLGSVWGHKLYIVYPIVSLSFALLVAVAVLATLVLTTFQLAASDRGWQWRSFVVGAASAPFLYGYCVYFYAYRSGMSGGSLQAACFLGYAGLAVYGLGLLLGSLGFGAARLLRRSCGCGFEGGEEALGGEAGHEGEREAAVSGGIMVIRSRRARPLVN